MEHPALSLPSAELSAARKHTEGIQLASVATAFCNDSGDLAGSTFRSLEQRCSKPSMPELRVEFTPWRLTQSQFRYRGTPNTYDLGVIR
jgi:hypothetical protein